MTASQGESRSLYHRWRSRFFSELVAQEHVTRTLKNAVANGRIVHAYLFCGPRGTGKTSTARILAKAVNCLDPQEGEPCNRCASCQSVNEGRAMDLIEIDAASNRGIDDARDLREKIKFSPVESKYKVYIIDEAHMLTSEASNALLKTLEEPPDHALLILATTESHKILPTIASRCQRFDFRRIPTPSIVDQLAMICDSEGVQVEPGVLERVARMARGGMRDAESLMDQLIAYCGDRLDLASTREVLGLTGEEMVPEFAEAMRRGDLAAGFRLIDVAVTNGADLRHISRELVEHLRTLMVLRSGADTSLTREYRGQELEAMAASARQWDYGQLLTSLRVLGDLEGRMRTEPFNQMQLEMAFLQTVLENSGATRTEPSPRVGVTSAGENRPAVEVAPRAAPQPAIVRTVETASEPAAPTIPPEAAAAPLTPAPEPETVPAQPVVERFDLEGVKKAWPRIVESMSHSLTLGMVMRGCQPLEVSGSVITLGFEKPMWKDIIEKPENQRKLAESLAGVSGTKVTVRFRYGVKVSRAPASPGRDAVVETAVKELGFRVSRVEGITE